MTMKGESTTSRPILTLANDKKSFSEAPSIDADGDGVPGVLPWILCLTTRVTLVLVTKEPLWVHILNYVRISLTEQATRALNAVIR